jgi:hypothetical protein
MLQLILHLPPWIEANCDAVAIQSQFSPARTPRKTPLQQNRPDYEARFVGVVDWVAAATSRGMSAKKKTTQAKEA